MSSFVGRYWTTLVGWASDGGHRARIGRVRAGEPTGCSTELITSIDGVVVVVGVFGRAEAYRP